MGKFQNFFRAARAALVLSSFLLAVTGCGEKNPSDDSSFLNPKWPTPNANGDDPVGSESPIQNPTSAKTALRKVASSDLPQIDPDGNRADFELAIQRQLAKCALSTSKTKWNFDGRQVTKTEWCTETLTQILAYSRQYSDWGTFYSKIRDEFDWYKSTGKTGASDVQYTGYFYPTLRGSRTKTSVYKYPVYQRPSDLIQTTVSGKKVWRRSLGGGKTTPYYTRKEIDIDGALKGRKLEIAYVSDPFELFILQIQGSGKIDIPGEGAIFINYAAQNGQSYVSIGGVLRRQGVDPSYLTLQGMRRYFKEHPNELWPVLLQNPSYVFFSEALDGPYGAAGTVLVPGHSIAIDTSIFPLGAFALTRLVKPDRYNDELVKDWAPLLRTTVTQDTGGAIRGAGRVDFFWGSGPYEELSAGQLNHVGELYLALPKKLSPYP